MSTIRSFVAVELSDDARRDLAGLEEKLRASGADVKWVAPGSLHLTLKFLGDVEAQDIRSVAQALAKATAESGAFSLTLSGVGAFPSTSRPRVVWVGVTGGKERLASLAAMVEAALVPLGFPPEGRAFSPHLTLGRCRSDRGVEDLRAAMDAQRGYSGPSVAVDRVVLFASDLRPAGPVYTPLETFPL